MVSRALPPDAAALRFAPRLATAAAALVALTFGLIVLGALVRAHDAGLACPDWPRCFGTWIPAMDMRVAFEWTHRLVAGSVALLFLALCAAVWRTPSLRPALRGPMALAAALLAVQIVLGGLTVLLRLASWTVTAHLLTGNAFAATLLVIRNRLVEIDRPLQRAPTPWLLRAGLWAALVLLLVQMTLGGLVASTYAGLACPEWPTCAGGQWFPEWRGSVGVHLAHRSNGYLLASLLVMLALAARSTVSLARPLALAAGLALAQIGVGVANVLLAIPAEITGLHSALAAALVLTCVHATYRSWPLAARVP